jgi:hypothetical protein
MEQFARDFKADSTYLNERLLENRKLQPSGELDFS